LNEIRETFSSFSKKEPEKTVLRTFIQIDLFLVREKGQFPWKGNKRTSKKADGMGVLGRGATDFAHDNTGIILL